MTDPDEQIPTGAVPTAAIPPLGEVPTAAAGTATPVADLAVLASLAHRPLAEHADVYQQVHEQLQTALAGLDAG